MFKTCMWEVGQYLGLNSFKESRNVMMKYERGVKKKSDEDGSLQTKLCTLQTELISKFLPCMLITTSDNEAGWC